MRGEPTCPRCGVPTRPPGVWSSRWSCRQHGEVFPLAPLVAPSARLVRQVADRVSVPLWLPWPLPRGWVVSAVLTAGDDVSGVHGCAVVTSGPNPLGGPADLCLVAEEPGVGLGAGLAGLEHADPGPAVQGQPHARFQAGGRPIPLWWVDAPAGRAVYAGQWAGHWLWAILRPDSAAALLLEDVSVADVRELGLEVDLLGYGSPPSWLDRHDA